MNRFVPATFALLLISSLVFGVSVPGSNQRPNILFILTEDQGAQMGALGTAGVQTPHMDELAATGVMFREAFVVYPVCSASKGSIYTGRFATSAGILNNTLNLHKPAGEVTKEERETSYWRHNRIRDDVPTLIECLRAGGYYSAVTHKLHVLPNDKFPYDEFLENPGGELLRGFIERAGKHGKPWFMMYNIEDSHREYPNSDVEKIRVRSDEVKLPAFLPDTPEIRKDWAGYLAALEKADRWVGEALAALRASGQWENTIIVFMGDHGPTFPHGKMTLFDLGLRVPLVIAGPGVKGGRESKAGVSAVDLMPTLLDFAGLPVPTGMQGKSLRALAEGVEGASGHAQVFAQISNRGPLPNEGMQERSVYDGRWKLIYREKTETRWRQVNDDAKFFIGPTGRAWGNRTYAEIVKHKKQFPEAYRMLREMDPQSLDGETPKWELYDLKNDPDELRNLAEKPECREIREKLFSTLKAHFTAISDPAMTWR